MTFPRGCGFPVFCDEPRCLCREAIVEQKPTVVPAEKSWRPADRRES